MPRRTVVDPRFPACLRELRQGAGLSVRAFAGRAYVSRSYISELENGRKPPTVAIARRLDDALHAGGELAGLVTLAAPDGVTRDDTDRLAYAVQHPRRLDVATIDVLATLLAGQRRLEDVLGAATVLTPAAAQVAMVEELVDGARGLLRPRMVAVGAEWAQFAGWLSAQASDATTAREWYLRSLEWATEAGDPDMVATALSMRGHLAWLAGQPGPVVGLTQAAGRLPASHGVRALAAQQQARGHAMLGEAREVDRLLGHAVELVGQAAANPPWAYFFDGSYLTLQRGLAYRPLGRSTEAVRLLSDGLAGLPDSTARTEWAAAYAGELAAAHLSVGDRAAAEAALRRVRAVAKATGSVRLRRQLRRLSAALSADT